MIFTMPARIVFSNGAEVSVLESAKDVRKKLSEDKVTHSEPFSQFTLDGYEGEEANVFVAAERVAYVQHLSS
jgi:hypothetical protein